MRTSTIFSAAALSLALVLTGCGNDQDKAAAESISAKIQKDSKSSSVKATKDQADCLGNGLVDKVGIDKLKKYKVLDDKGVATDATFGGDEKMDKEDADASADVFVGCIGPEGILEQVTGGTQDLPAEVEACFKEKLTDEVMKATLSATFQHDSEAASKASAPLQGCMANSMTPTSPPSP